MSAPVPCFSLWGVSHQTAPLPVRELWALNEPLKEQVLPRLRDAVQCQTIALSTCNRTEFYFHGLWKPTYEIVTGVLREVKGQDLEGGRDVCYFHEQEAAVDHLFRVASGLDSQILGETEIQGQVRSDLLLARGIGTCGHELGRLFDHALRVGKRVRSETAVSEGVLSAGQAGVLLAGKILGSLGSSRVLLVGTGKIGRLTAQALLDLGVARLSVTSRTEANARRLAKEFNAAVVPFERVREAVAESDLVISSTASSLPLFDGASLAPLLRSRSDRALVIIDLAMPRDFAPDVASLENVFLHDLDDLEAVLIQSKTQRLAELPQCEAIVEEEARKFLVQQTYRLEIEPLVGGLMAAVSKWRSEHVERETGNLPAATKEIVDAVTERLVRRLLLIPVNRLKEMRNRGELSSETLGLLRALFEMRPDDEDRARGNPRQ